MTFYYWHNRSLVFFWGDAASVQAQVAKQGWRVLGVRVGKLARYVRKLRLPSARTQIGQTKESVSSGPVLEAAEKDFLKNGFSRTYGRIVKLIIKL